MQTGEEKATQSARLPASPSETVEKNVEKLTLFVRQALLLQHSDNHPIPSQSLAHTTPGHPLFGSKNRTKMEGSLARENQSSSTGTSTASRNPNPSSSSSSSSTTTTDTPLAALPTKTALDHSSSTVNSRKSSKPQVHHITSSSSPPPSSLAIPLSSLPAAYNDPQLLYNSAPPEVLGRAIFEKLIPGLESSQVVSIIGQDDAYHAAVLRAYMNCFNFAGLELDVAFRTFCYQLSFSGESQMLDRLLYEFSRRYFETLDSDMSSLYKSTDVAYVIVFSLVLLNTDFHIAATRSMKLNSFLKNTLHVIESLPPEREVDLAPPDEVEAIGLASPPEPVDGKEKEVADAQWRRDMESLLTNFYLSIKSYPLSAKPDLPPYSAPQFSLFRNNSLSSLSSRSSRSSIFSFSRTSPVYGTLDIPRSPSRALVSPVREKVLSCMSIPIQGFLNRKCVMTDDMTKAKNRRWTRMYCQLRLSYEYGIEMLCFKSCADMDSSRLKEGDLLNCLHAFASRVIRVERDGATSLTVSAPLPGQQPLSLPLDIHADSGVGRRGSCLLEREVGESGWGHEDSNCDSPESTSSSPHAAEGVLIDPAAEFGTGKSAATTAASSTLPPMSIAGFLGAISTDRAQTSRSNVFTLVEHTGAETYFEAEDAATRDTWIQLINLNAGLRSKEPLSSLGSQPEYGWNRLLTTSPTSTSPAALPDESRADVGHDERRAQDALMSQSLPSASSYSPDRYFPAETDAAHTYPLKKDEFKTLRIVEYIPPGGLGRVVSHHETARQLDAMRGQHEVFKEELAAHDRMHDRLLVLMRMAGKAIHARVMENFARKRVYLKRECVKYRLYVAVLEEKMDHDAAEGIGGGETPVADLLMAVSPNYSISPPPASLLPPP